VSLELRQHLKMSQQLVMTPQLQQAIKLLQLSRLELVDLIRTEINENPLLDEAPEEDERAEGASPAEARLERLDPAPRSRRSPRR
jgi:RNA polymerase sigma-54 factor